MVNLGLSGNANRDVVNFTRPETNKKKTKTASNKADMNLKAKNYRKVLNTCYKKYTDKCASELRSLSQ
jgi:hypothetical protein